MAGIPCNNTPQIINTGAFIQVMHTGQELGNNMECLRYKSTSLRRHYASPI